MTTQALRRPGTRTARRLATGSLLLVLQRGEDPLRLDARERIYRHVRDYPGLHLSEIARNVEMDTNHAKYHLRVLEEHDLVSSQTESGYVRFYPRTESEVGRREVLQPDEKRWLSLLRRKTPLRATLVLLERGASSAGELQDALDIAPSTVHYHGSKMEDAGLVVTRKKGRKRIYELADPHRVQAMLETHQPPDALVEGFLAGWEELEFP